MNTYLDHTRTCYEIWVAEQDQKAKSLKMMTKLRSARVPWQWKNTANWSLGGQATGRGQDVPTTQTPSHHFFRRGCTDVASYICDPKYSSLALTRISRAPMRATWFPWHGFRITVARSKGAFTIRVHHKYGDSGRVAHEAD